jgi:CSLREA domain-containing protein
VSGAQHATGGLVGYNIGGTIVGSYATGDVAATTVSDGAAGTGYTDAGGLVGRNWGSVSTSFSTGNVTNIGNYVYTGGLVGNNQSGNIADSYALGNVTATGRRYTLTGGLVGFNYQSVVRSHSTGTLSVSASGPLIATGGLVGLTDAPGTVTASYWDTTTSSRATSSGGSGLPDPEMRQQASFVDWDFAGTWSIADGVTWPYLQWQTPAITGAAPAADATDVATDATVTVTFKGAMDSATLTDSTFFLTVKGSATHVAATLGWDGDTKTATLTPTERLSATTTFTATVIGGSAGVRDPAGGTLSAGGKWDFTTAAEPATLVVNTTSDTDDGTCDTAHCSLREAITAANGHANAGAVPDTIAFNIPTADAGYDAGSGLWTIRPVDPGLPKINDAVVIDGYSQPGAEPATDTTAAALKIVLDGASAGYLSNGLYLDDPGTGSTIKGLAIGRFSTAVWVESNDNTVRGNHLGTNAAGTAAAANDVGVEVRGDDNTIGGATAAARNVISGNSVEGISMSGTRNVIVGNFVGTDASGEAAVPNSEGIFAGAANNTIGGTTAVERNVISGNSGHGLRVGGAITVQGNYVGPTASGTGTLGNAAGLEVWASGVLIGGTDVGAGNVIAGNALEGIVLRLPGFGTPGTGLRILGNSIHDNGKLGINLEAATDAGAGVTSNDAGDADTGANNLQNFPALTTATSGATSTTIVGTLHSTPSSTGFRIELFSSSACDVSGHGEGQTYLGYASVDTDSSGNATIDETLSTAVEVGRFITATATDAYGNTSEFSSCVTVAEANEAPTDISLDNSTVAENQDAGTTVGTFSTTDPDGGAFLVAAIPVFTYSLVTGTGSTDNASFEIDGDMLKTAAIFDFETKSSYSIRVRSADAGGLGVEEVFTITVSNVNEAPTDISLSASSVAENQDAGTTVGTFSTTDPDGGDSFTYILVAGEGDTDNASFMIDGAALKTAASFDTESTSSYTVRIRATDAGTLSYEDAFTISVTSVNEDPTDIGLSASSVAENQVSGTTVGTLSTTDPDAGDSFTYTLVSGTGDSDNASFKIDGDSLKTAAAFDFETKSSYSIRIQTSDGALTFAKAFTISVTNANETPTAIDLSNSTVEENQPIGTAVGTFSTADPDAGDSFTYTLVSGSGSVGNGSFTIDGNTLKTDVVFDKETGGGYAIRVRSTDAGSLWAEQIFTINLADVNEAPTDISLSPSSVAENQPAGTTVGTMSTTDPDSGDSFTYSLVSGDGDTDNGSFTIDGGSLKTAASFDYEATSSYSIRVQTSDGALTYEEAFTITVSDVNEAPTISDVPNQAIVVNTSTGALAVTIGDPETPAAELSLGATSDNKALVPDASIVVGGSDANRTVTVSPATDQTGSATITLTVGDGELTATDMFLVSVGIGEPPKVTTQPGSQTITEGRNATFTAEGAGAPTPTVHWEVSTDRGRTWTDLVDGVGGVSGANTGTLFIEGVTHSMSGYRYRAVFVNQNGTVASDAATLTIKAVPSAKPTKYGTTVTLVSDANPSTDGAVTLTATVTPMTNAGPPSGTVTFREGQSVLGEATLVDGSGSLTLANELRLVGGEHDITARYGGSTTYNPSSSGIYHQVVGTTTTDVAVTMTGEPIIMPSGLPGIRWSIKVWNLGDQLASSVLVQMTLDKATKLAAVHADEGMTWVTKGRTTTVLLGDLEPGTTTTIQIDAELGKAPRTDVTIPSTVTVSTASLDMNESNDTSTASVTVTPITLAGTTTDGVAAIVTEPAVTVSLPRRRRRAYRGRRARRTRAFSARRRSWPEPR